MGVPQSVTTAELQVASAAAGDRPAIDIFLSQPQKRLWEPMLVWSASQFLEENTLFMLAVSKYKLAPTQQKMDYLYKRFVGHGKQRPDREINIPSAARETIFEIVTGARTRSGPGGGRADAFDAGVRGLRGQVASDINGRFDGALHKDPGNKFTISAAQKSAIDRELADFSKIGINL